MERSCRWTRPELLARQSAAFDGLRRFVQERSAFYRKFHAGLESRPLSGLPVLTKATLMESFDELVTDGAVRLSDAEAYLASAPGERLFLNRYVVRARSGSTGLRGVFLFGRDEWLTALAAITRPMLWAGAAPNPFRPRRTVLLASTSDSHYSSRIGRALASRLVPTLRMDAAEPIARMVERLNDWQPEVMGVYPSVLRQLAAEQIAGRLRIRPWKIGTSAEVL